MGFRPLSEAELAIIESSLRKSQRDTASVPSVSPAPASVNDQITDAVTASSDDATADAPEESPVEAKPAGKNPFKKKP
jgi:hypothetical protein